MIIRVENHQTKDGNHNRSINPELGGYRAVSSNFEWSEYIAKRISELLTAVTGMEVIPDQYGLIPRIAKSLLAQQAMSVDHVVLRCSYCEVYNEQVYDLFAKRSAQQDSRPRLSVCEGSDGVARVRNLQLQQFNHMEDLMQLLSFGAQRRSVRQTALNHKSSRGVPV